jgi:hypothetical protein
MGYPPKIHSGQSADHDLGSISIQRGRDHAWDTLLQLIQVSRLAMTWAPSAFREGGTMHGIPSYNSFRSVGWP